MSACASGYATVLMSLVWCTTARVSQCMGCGFIGVCMHSGDMLSVLFFCVRNEGIMASPMLRTHAPANSYLLACIRT